MDHIYDSCIDKVNRRRVIVYKMHSERGLYILLNCLYWVICIIYDMLHIWEFTELWSNENYKHTEKKHFWKIVTLKVLADKRRCTVRNQIFKQFNAILNLLKILCTKLLWTVWIIHTFLGTLYNSRFP